MLSIFSLFSLVKGLFLASLLKYIFTGHRITVSSLSFGTRRKSVCCLLVPVLFDEKFAIVQIVVLLFKTQHFSLDIFKIFLFIVGYQQLNYVGFLRIYAPWGSLRHLNL